MTPVYDLAVVGGSFAGLACAAAAASRGLHTVVIDRKPSADAAVRTTGILVKEAADEWDVPHELLRRFPGAGVRVYAPGGRFMDLHRPGYAFYATDTGRLMRWFAERAAVFGAELRWGSALRSIERRGTQGGAPGSSLRLGLVDGEHIEARYVIGADGARSKVAELLGLGRNRAFLTGVELEYANVRGIDPTKLHVWIDRELAPGYIGWVVPAPAPGSNAASSLETRNSTASTAALPLKPETLSPAPGSGPGSKKGVTQIGLAVRQPRKQRLELFERKLRGIFDFSEAEVVGGRGGVIPVGGPVRRMGCEGAVLVGDAAGMVSPLTAGGIHTALHYGRLAGIAAADWLLDGGPEPAEVMRRERPGFGFKRVMRWMMDVGVPNRVVDLAMDWRVSRAVAQSVFYHHRGLWSARTWTDAARLALAR